MTTSDQDFFTDSLGQKWRKDYFIYSCTVTALAPNATVAAIINIESDSQFVWCKTNYFAIKTGDPSPTTLIQLVPKVNVSITDTGSGRNLQNQPVSISTLAGHQGLPFVLPQPRLFKENTSISTTFTNLDVANTFDIWFSFCGYKLFRV